jgi:hypothetical protein
MLSFAQVADDSPPSVQVAGGRPLLCSGSWCLSYAQVNGGFPSPQVACGLSSAQLAGGILCPGSWWAPLPR